MTTVFATDQQNDPDILSINGASAALMLSSVPFHTPVGGVRMGHIDGRLVVNPTQAQLVDSTMEIIVAGTEDAIMMVEGEAREVSESAARRRDLAGPRGDSQDHRGPEASGCAGR